ncbi:hypothetical protein M422DRAFT_783505 [Sphaerobolus stellatus SS14]|uniref:Uncharacterized protein n=1 Tax=Sphaerobolus stellatus (strain SS14) TaxID=990650 RepID=A0A0C9UCK1_SPHS4|nr:hypothetical protein M422DRAFT_783505 [Sphaerobolus stellatus SS14]
MPPSSVPPPRITICTVSATKLPQLLTATPISVTHLYLNIVDGTEWNRNSVTVATSQVSRELQVT